MAESEKVIRAAKNEMKGSGYLKSIDLKKINYEDKDGVTRSAIRGDVTICVEPEKSYALSIYCREATKSGVSKTYSFLESLMDAGSELDSMEEILKRQAAVGVKLTREQAMLSSMKLYFTGTVEPFEFLDEKDNFVSRLKLKASYLGNSKADNFSPEIKFDVETYIEEMYSEKDENGDTTGRGIVKGVTPLYGGKVVNLSFVVDKDMKDVVFTKYNPEKTAELWGLIETTITEKEDDTPSEDVAFGVMPDKPKARSYSTELILTGGLNPYSGQNELAYSKEEITKAKIERENLLEQNKSNYSKEKKTTTNSNIPTGNSRPPFKFS